MAGAPTKLQCDGRAPLGFIGARRALPVCGNKGVTLEAAAPSARTHHPVLRVWRGVQPRVHCGSRTTHKRAPAGGRAWRRAWPPPSLRHAGRWPHPHGIGFLKTIMLNPKASRTLYQGIPRQKKKVCLRIVHVTSLKRKSAKNSKPCT